MKNSVLYTDEELMQGIKVDNMFAFDLLYKRYCNRVYKFGYSILKSDAETQNLMQDVFLRLWENRHKVEKDEAVKTFIFTITYNSAISVIRKKAKESEYFQYLNNLQVIYEQPVNADLEFKELTCRLEKIVEGLPIRQREIFIMHKMESLKYSEIAERLNISVNTIETHMCRALKTIREKIYNYTLFIIIFLFLFV